MVTILTDDGDFAVDASLDAAGGLRLKPDDLERVAGWTLKPEGLCRGSVCVPLRDADANDGRVDLAAFWRHLGQPLLSDAAGETWVLGTGAEARNESLVGLEAPDITLPDLAGVPHSLSSLRGRKILLATWASW